MIFIYIPLFIVSALNVVYYVVARDFGGSFWLSLVLAVVCVSAGSLSIRGRRR